MNVVAVLAGVLLYGLAAYGLWRLWSRPRLLVLREEAQRTRYRVPGRLLALYVLALAVAPLTGIVVVLAWCVAESKRLTHSWKQWRSTHGNRGLFRNT